MEYNSQRELLKMPEYGRNVQKLIDYAKTIEDPTQKQAFIEQIVDLMLQMSPQSRNLDDYRDKLWRHVFKIADYELTDVYPPNGIMPSRERDEKRPEPIGYPVSEARFRHYGHNVQKLIKKAISMEKGPIRNGFVETIGNYMKLAYKTWNKDHYVSDDIILGDLETLSNGMLKMEDDASLDNLSNSNRRRKRNVTTSSSSSRERDNRDTKGRNMGSKKRRK